MAAETHMTMVRSDCAGTRPMLAASLGLTLLIAVLYSDISDFLMRRAPVPSMLQLLIFVLVCAVWVRRDDLRPGKAMTHPAILALAVYALVVFTTSIWAADVSLADERLSEIVKALLIAVLAATLVQSRRSLKLALTTLVAVAAGLAAMSVLQIATGGFQETFGGLVAPQVGTISEHILDLRAAGPPNSDPNFYARILLMAAPIAVGLAVIQRTLARRMACAAAGAIIVAGTLVTYSRGAMLSLAVAAVLLLVGLQVRARHVALAVAAGIIVLLLLPSGVTRRFMTIETLMPDYAMNTGDYDSSVEKRKLLVRSGLAMFDAHPMTGVGAGHYGREYARFANEIGSSWIDYHAAGTKEHPHGLYFEIAAETGILGLLPFAAAVLAILFSVNRARRTFTAYGSRDLSVLAMCVGVAIVSYLAASVFLHETHLRYPALYIGFAMALAQMAQREPLEARP